VIVATIQLFEKFDVGQHRGQKFAFSDMFQVFHPIPLSFTPLPLFRRAPSSTSFSLKTGPDEASPPRIPKNSTARINFCPHAVLELAFFQKLFRLSRANRRVRFCAVIASRSLITKSSFVRRIIFGACCSRLFRLLVLVFIE